MTPTIRLALLDFDGTLVTHDILDLLCGIVGKEAESREINAAFHRGDVPGLSALVQRINFLKGVTQSQISEALKPNAYLMPGALELMEFFKKHHIITILASGNIVPFLKYYQQLLGVDHLVGSEPQMNGDAIVGINESAFSSQNFKLDGINNILENYDFKKENIVALGDSPSDKGMFEMSGFSIAVNPKGNIADFADAVVKEDLREVITLLES
jgi:HAD superfamily phosphoserine phosphatase-like hydrolase